MTITNQHLMLWVTAAPIAYFLAVFLHGIFSADHLDEGYVIAFLGVAVAWPLVVVLVPTVFSVWWLSHAIHDTARTLRVWRRLRMHDDENEADENEA